MKTRVTVLVALIVLLVLPAAIYAQETDPEAVVKAFFEAFNAGDVDSAVAYYADDAVWHLQPFYEPYVGKEAIRAACEAIWLYNYDRPHLALDLKYPHDVYINHSSMMVH